MDYDRIYETIKNFRHAFEGYTLKQLKEEYDNYSLFEISHAFHKLTNEGYFEIEKISKNDYRINKVLK